MICPRIVESNSILNPLTTTHKKYSTTTPVRIYGALVPLVERYIQYIIVATKSISMKSLRVNGINHINYANCGVGYLSLIILCIESIYHLDHSAGDIESRVGINQRCSIDDEFISSICIYLLYCTANKITCAIGEYGILLI